MSKKGKKFLLFQFFRSLNVYVWILNMAPKISWDQKCGKHILDTNNSETTVIQIDMTKNIYEMPTEKLLGSWKNTREDFLFIYLHNLLIRMKYTKIFTWYGAPPISFIEKPIGKSMAARQKNITENKMKKYDTRYKMYSVL